MDEALKDIYEEEASEQVTLANAAPTPEVRDFHEEVAAEMCSVANGRRQH